MQISADVASLLRAGLSNAEVSRRTGIHPVKISAARQALHLPDHREMTPGYVAPPSRRSHGTRAKYVEEKCRCTPCRQANRKAENRRTRLKAYGQWAPFVDAEPVRAHLLYLQSCGMGLRAIAAAAQVNRRQLQFILTGRSDRKAGPQQAVRPALAEAVLAVKPSLDVLAPNSVITATGTTRRLQALVAIGWPQMHLAAEIGWTTTNLGVLIGATTVTVATARLVRDLYDRLWNVAPLAHGASPGGVTWAKQRALKAGWAPVGAWDDDRIDDPDAFPDWTGECGTHSGYATHRARGVPICGPCRDAHSLYRRELRERRAASAATAA